MPITLIPADRLHETKTEPTLEQIAGSSGIGGSIRDSSITVIENPSGYARRGLVGVLLAAHFSEQNGREIVSDVAHYRIGSSGKNAGRVFAFEHYDRVAFYDGKSLDGSPYHFASPGSKTLPSPSILPYKICFITPDEYADFMAGLSGKAVRETVNKMYELLADREPIFRFENGRLVLPENYASSGL